MAIENVVAGPGAFPAGILPEQGVCDPDAALDSGPYCATLYGDDLARPRHMAVAPNGDRFVAGEESRGSGGGGGWALRDLAGDGRADIREHFGTLTGVASYGGSAGGCRVPRALDSEFDAVLSR